MALLALTVVIVAGAALWTGRAEGMVAPSTPGWHCAVMSRGRVLGHGVMHGGKAALVPYSPAIRASSPKDLEIVANGKRLPVTRVISDPSKTLLVLRVCPGSMRDLGSWFAPTGVPFGTTLWAVTPARAVVPVRRITAPPAGGGPGSLGLGGGRPGRTDHRGKPVADQARALVTFQSRQCLPPGTVVYAPTPSSDRTYTFDTILAVIDDTACGGGAAKYAFGLDAGKTAFWLQSAMRGDGMDDNGNRADVRDPPC